VAYVLSWVAVAAAMVGWTVASAPAPQLGDWERFGAMAGCACAYLVFTRRYEETRRSRTIGPHIDVTSVWTFAGLVVLPAPLAVALILFVRTQRWFAARRPLYRFVFSTGNMVIAALLAKLLLGVLGVSGSSGSGWIGSLRELGAIAAGGAVYIGVPALIIAGVISMVKPSVTLSDLFGSPTDNGLEALSVLVGIGTALLVLNVPAAVVVMVPVSVILNRVGEIQKLLQDARTDPKTGLLNMRGWQESAGKEFARADRSGNPIALFMVDLDHFKSINDTWGHPAGDDMLSAVAKVLKAETRPADLVGRFGGEEFVVLLPDTNADEAVAAAERIRAQIAGLSVPTTDKRGRPVVITDRTTSIGVSSRPTHGLTLDPLLQAADAAVYGAKESGRNQVRVAGEGDTAPAEHQLA
jgi:diguanylate cyclase (GGDEF)-like protein